MAKPRIFVSSTFYDLKHVRNEIEAFIKNMGYDPILNERGKVPYPNDKPLDESCYQEVRNCDMLVSIIGGRFGSNSSANPQFSISQKELQTAHEQQKQIFIFIEKSVHSEYQTYKKNKDKEIEFAYVDNVKIFEFIEWLESLQINNAIAGFETGPEINNYLREQWAGMLHDHLRDLAKEKEISLSQRLESTASTLNAIVKTLSKLNESSLNGIRSSNNDILTQNLLTAHPIFSNLRQLLRVPYRIFFATRDEMDEWLKTRGYMQDILLGEEDEEIWTYTPDKSNSFYSLTINKAIFDEQGQLSFSGFTNWNPSWVKLTKHERNISDDDIPF